MDEAGELQAAKDRVFLNIGRNVVLFQQMEVLLKEMLKRSHVQTEVNAHGPPEPQVVAPSDNRSLGKVARAVFKQAILPTGAVGGQPAHEPASTKITVSTRTAIESMPDEHAAHEAELRQAIIARNELVHSFVSKWNWQSKESMRAAEAYLIAQRESADGQYRRLKNLFDAQCAFQKDVVALMVSDEFQKHVELMLSPLVRAICDATAEHARPDGWTLVSNAGHYIARHQPEERLKLWEQYGFRSLGDLIEGAQLFEVRHEPSGAGTRQIYRLRTE